MTTPIDLPSVRDNLRQLIAEILYCETTDIEDNAAFRDLGLDSVLIVELMSKVNDIYGLAEKAETAHACPTLNQLSAHVAAKAGCEKLTM
ncbi:MAG: acyl carrier protein [Mycobacterium sp.]|nr:acyl carrier protein [Mycobacterium sp.]